MTTSALTVADAVHASTLGAPETQEMHLASNSEMLDNSAKVTEETLTAKALQIAKVQDAMAAVRSHRVGLGPLQAVVVGELAALLPLNPTNKELALAMSETYDESYHGPKAVTVTIAAKESVEKHGAAEAWAGTQTSNPNPYAQAVRKYKILAQIEAQIVPKDSGWDLGLVSTGVLINSVQYKSPIAALQSGVVTMEAVFQCYMNILQPRVIRMDTWSTSQVKEAQAFAPKIKVTVRQFDAKMNRDQKVAINAVNSPGVLYGTISGLLKAATDGAKFKLSRKHADALISLVNGLTTEVVSPTI